MRRTVAFLVLTCFVLGMPVNSLAFFSCGADLNGDGFTDAAGETAACSSATLWEGQTAQWFCPVQSTDCQPDMTAPTLQKTCSLSGYSYIASRDRCESQPICAGGSYNAATDQCDGGGTPSPAQATFSTCSATGNSILSINLNLCNAVPGGSCQVGQWNLFGSPFYYYANFDSFCNWTTVTVGTQSGLLPSPTVMNLAPGASYNTTYNGQVILTYTNATTAQYSCPSGSTLSGTNCVTPSLATCNGGQLDTVQDICFSAAAETPVCNSGTFDPATGKCDQGTFSCPSGNYSCLDTGGAIPQCSPNPCIDVANPSNDVTILPSKDPMLQNDGQVDANGNCLGEIYIFSGKATRCRPGGMTVGYANDCCDSSDPVVMDSTTGSKINDVASAISTVYEMAQVGYYSYQISTGAMAAVEYGGQVAVYNMANGTIAASYASGTATASGVMAAQGTATAGAATTTGTVSSGLSSYAGALFNPTTIAIAIVVMVVMKVMFGDGCSPEDIETAMLANSDYCHYLGTVCERKWKFVGCVQRAKRFCCFNSKMARIVQEQGRPQLQAFGPSGGWGTAENPNCRGFTPQEFQQLDFSRIDLTEYFGDIQRNMSQKIQDAQSTVQQKVQEHYQQIR